MEKGEAPTKKRIQVRNISRCAPPHQLPVHPSASLPSQASAFPKSRAASAKCAEFGAKGRTRGRNLLDEKADVLKKELERVTLPDADSLGTYGDYATFTQAARSPSNREVRPRNGGGNGEIWEKSS